MSHLAFNGSFDCQSGKKNRWNSYSYYSGAVNPGSRPHYGESTSVSIGRSSRRSSWTLFSMSHYRDTNASIYWNLRAYGIGQRSIIHGSANLPQSNPSQS